MVIESLKKKIGELYSQLMEPIYEELPKVLKVGLEIV